jgi:hypothetical protein
VIQLRPTFDDLQGVWQNAELQPQPDGAEPDRYVRYRFTFAGGDWCLDFAGYATRAGDRPLFDVRAGGTYALGGAWQPVPGSRRLDLTFTCRYLTVFAPAMLSALHEEGYPTARLGQRTDVTRRGALFVPSLAQAPVEYDLALLHEGELRLGAGAGAGTRPEDRPTAPQPFGLRRVEQ